MKKRFFILIILLLFVSHSFFGLKFIIPIKDKNSSTQNEEEAIEKSKQKELILLTIFESGFSAKAVADGIGLSDYISTYIKTAFHIQQFGIGFEFDFRFRIFNGQLLFVDNNWVYNQNFYNSELNTFFLYLDKIEYIKYGNADSPFYLNIGRLPYISFGSGFLVRDFHNHAFEPVEKEQGLYFRFNGSYLDKFKWLKIPVDATFFINDLLDPDIFALDAGVDVMQFTRFKEIFKNRAGFSFVTDINASENNRVSSLYEDSATSHRNLSTTDYNLYTSFPFFFSLNNIFIWTHEKVQINGFFESIFLTHFKEKTTFGAGLKLAVETKTINLKKNGFLLGIKLGFIMQSPYFFTDYFSSNYEILRHKQIIKLDNNNEYTFFILFGLNIYGLNEKIKFITEFKFPIQDKAFIMKMSMKFIMEDTLVKGLGIGIYYETGVNAYYIRGEGAGFIESLTRDFRFAVECSFKFYSAKFMLQVGIQRPAWCIPKTSGYIKPYEILSNGGIINYNDPLSYSENIGIVDLWNFDSKQFKNDIQKFVKLEISFVI